eukprot:6350657-Pyramimonas_sp.AAC.1
MAVGEKFHKSGGLTLGSETNVLADTMLCSAFAGFVRITGSGGFMFGLESPTSPPEITQKQSSVPHSSFILDNFAQSEFSQ